jgi:hypothetical protein
VILRTFPQKAISLALIVAGSGLEFSSCCPEILRNGNEPIAGMIAILGLLAIAGGWLGLRSVSLRLTEHQRVRRSLFFEHLLYCAALGAWWLIAERETFFVDTPFGRDILGYQKLLVAAFVVVAILSMALRAALCAESTRIHRRNPFPISAAAWRAAFVGVVIMAGLNAAQGQEILRLDGGLQVSVLSRGFPLPAVERLEFKAPDDRVLTRTRLSANSLTLDDGTEVRRLQDSVTVLRYGRSPKHFEGTSSLRLPDDTRIEFQGRKVTVSLRGRTPIIVDVAAESATFPDGATARSDTRAIVLDLFVGLILAVHFGVCSERQERGHTELATRNFYAPGT